LPNHKVIVFFTTARLTQFYAEMFNGMQMKVLEIHSRKSQAQRDKVSQTFRSAKTAVMFSSDVSARGMDYPDITGVIQVGMPTNREQYVHRLGRTARAGKGGWGVLIICDFEKKFLNQIKDLPTIRLQPLSEAELGDLRQAIDGALSRIPKASFTTAYQAWMGFYNSSLKSLGWSPADLVELANHWICTICNYGPFPPALQAKTIGKMGLKGTPGLIVEKFVHKQQQ